jgi:Calcineurin-like phosphoesterase
VPAAEPPPRPRDETREELGFERQGMVRWFDPIQLAGTGVQVAVSAIFGSYSDKREIQAALAPAAKPHLGYADADELWFDYVADLGDGFEATYTVASLLGRPKLALERDGRTWDTERGRLLVMGGDQVYPTATRTEYENRLVGPYRAALPFVGENPPRLYAIPGNHDWYDGLTNFIRIFCRGQWIGGWHTTQERSYFALQLPHRWWLWAIDIQFDTYIDEPQLEYFQSAKALLQDGDRLILATGKPSWTASMKPHPEPSYANLAYFEDELLKETKAKLAVVVSGDKHHYARYEDATGTRHRITSGGGGAYLFPTHHLAPRIDLEEGRKQTKRTVSYELQTEYPPTKVSRQLRWAAPVRLPLRNVRIMRFLGALYFGLAMLLQVPVRRNISGDVGVGDVLPLWGDALTSRWVIFAALVAIPLFALFAAGSSFGLRAVLGVLHAIPHVLLVSLLVPVSAWVLSGIVDLHRYGLAIAAVAAVLAVPLGAAILGLYLAVCDLAYERAPDRLEGLDRHANEAFSCQGIEDWKSFLRFHIDTDGRLTIFPIGVERSARAEDLQFNRTDDPEAPYFTVSERVGAQLIEDPVVCDR